MRSHLTGFVLFAFIGLLAVAGMAPAASAAVLLGRVDKWSPHRDAPTDGWTTVMASKNLGSVDWGQSKKYRAKNSRTVFGRQGDSGAVVKLSRNRFFRILGSYRNYVSMNWRWRGPEGHRYRYVISICAIRAGGQEILGTRPDLAVGLYAGRVLRAARPGKWTDGHVRYCFVPSRGAPHG